MKRLSKFWAIVNNLIVSLFFLASGLFEFTTSLFSYDRPLEGTLFLRDAYIQYLLFLGGTTFILGILIIIGMIFKTNFIRRAVIILSWWNLFSSPLIGFWYSYIYTTFIKNIYIIEWNFWTFYELLYKIMLITLPRLYIIYMLREDRAGYLFLRNQVKQ